MARAYTVRLGGGQCAAGTATVVGRGELNVQVVVRDITFYNGGVGVQRIYIQIVAGTDVITIATEDLDTGAVFHWVGRQVLEPGDELTVFPSLYGGTAAVTGYRFANL